MEGQMNCTPPCMAASTAATWHAAPKAADVYPAMDHDGLGIPAPIMTGYVQAYQKPWADSARSFSLSPASSNKAFFGSNFFWDIDTVALSIVFDKYRPIMN